MEIVFIDFMALAGLKARAEARTDWEKWQEEVNQALGEWAIAWIQAGHPNGVKFLGDRAIARFVGTDEPLHESFAEEVLIVHIPEFGRILIQKSRHTPTDVRNALDKYDAAVLTLADAAIP